MQLSKHGKTRVSDFLCFLFGTGMQPLRVDITPVLLKRWTELREAAPDGTAATAAVVMTSHLVEERRTVVLRQGIQRLNEGY